MTIEPKQIDTDYMHEDVKIELDAKVILECRDGFITLWDANQTRQLWSCGRCEEGAWEKVFNALTDAIDKAPM